MLDLPTGTVTFLFTDVEGSTRLWQEHPAAMPAAVARHDAILRRTIEAHDGRVFKTVGDACHAAFLHAADALAAALQAQEALQAEPWGDLGELRVRLALHTGDAEERDGDYLGQALNRTARILDVAHGGQVLLSATSYELVRDDLPAGAALRDLGPHRLRDLARPEHLYQLLAPGLRLDFPALRSLASYPNNLPLQLTSFVGREREMAEVRRLLVGSRLLTLTGAGGAGKTRLSLQVAASVLEAYSDGVWLVDLAALSDAGLVPRAVAQAVGVREEPGQPVLATLRRYLGSKRLLLLLDNCEHLLDACARLTDALLRGCPGLSVLATSREALGIAGESGYRVPSLSLPDVRQLPPVASLSQYEAVRLFVDRAVAVQPSFQVTNANAPAVAQVCWRLDGIPLAIELAAARVKVLTPEQLARRLDDRFRLLTGGSRTALRRQQTLRAAVDWSHDLLAESERVVLRRLAVFAGGCGLEAAEAVCAGAGLGGGIESADVLDLLSRLVDKSLVVVEEASGEARYRLLETLRQYAGEKLLEAGEAAAVRDRHLGWYLALAERAAPELFGRDERRWLARLEPEDDNLGAALEWGLARGDATTALRLGAALGEFWSRQNRWAEMRERLAAVLALPGGDPAARGRTLRWAAAAESLAGGWRQAMALNEQALALAWEIGDRRLIAVVLIQMGFLQRDQGELAEMLRLHEEALRVARESGDRRSVALATLYLLPALYSAGDDAAARRLADEWEVVGQELADWMGLAALLLVQGLLALGEGDLERARSLGETALARSREGPPRSYATFSLSLLGDVARAAGDLSAAERWYREALALWRGAPEDELRLVWLVIGLAGLWVSQGRAGAAARLYGAVRGWLGAMGTSTPWLAPRGWEQDEAAARAALGEAAWAAACAEGRAMTLEEAVEGALRGGAEA